MVATAPGVVRAAWLIPLLPLAGFFFLLLLGSRIKIAAGAVATTLMAASAGLSVWMLLTVGAKPESARTFVHTLYTWIGSGRFRISIDYRIDPLTIVMLLVVTGVGALIHLYSIGYMHGDDREHRYFAYLNLFAFSMLVLVMANNFLVMYVGWELVGLCSYLLIGFWFDRPRAASAAKKAFITNRVGDTGFALGLMLIFVTFGSLDFGKVFSAAPAVLHGATATAIALLLFAGAAGKSAQIPLYVWLPDAMEGPTPVSALIHAATMVTAGVYLVARSHVLFELSSIGSNVVAWIGGATALLAALIAFTQDDIKRILAYSTISQLGFMFMAVGSGAYAAGVFHLFTHAFFKALLFLGAGSVMHALANETDITKMGGLRKYVPWTAATFVLGWLAIIGFPGFAGFFSKDQILSGVYGSGRIALWIVGLAATFGTGFYMSRLVFLTFFGRYRGGEPSTSAQLTQPEPAAGTSPHAGAHGQVTTHGAPHESPPVMLWPLVILGVAAALAGIAGIGASTGRIQHFLAPALPHTVVHNVSGAADTFVPVVPERASGLNEASLSAIATAAGLAGAVVAGFMYLGTFSWQRRRQTPSLAWKASRNKFGVDELYQFIFTGAGRLVATALAYVVDMKWIDGAVNGLARGIGTLSAGARRLQTGLVRTYAVGILGGAVVLAAVFVARAR